MLHERNEVISSTWNFTGYKVMELKGYGIFGPKINGIRDQKKLIFTTWAEKR